MKQFTSSVLCLLVAFAVVALSSCKKDEVEAPSIQGYWVGKYGGATNYPTSFFAFVVKGDGTVKVYANNADTTTGSKGLGTYTFLDNKINITYKYPSESTIYNATATTTTGFTMMEGTWGSGASYSSGGKFFMGKQ